VALHIAPKIYEVKKFPSPTSTSYVTPKAASASPAGAHRAAKGDGGAIERQANSVLTVCLSPGDSSTDPRRRVSV